MTEIGIVVVTYNSGAEIAVCLQAALHTGAEIVVVDNASTDNTIAEIARCGVRLIANPENRGFAAAVNQGIESLRTPYVLLLNPDAVIQGGLDAMRVACNLPKTAGAGGKLLNPDGQPQRGFMVRRLPTARNLVMEALLLNRLWPDNPANRRYRALDLDDRALTPVEQPAGAFLMVRRVVWEEVHGFDESFQPLWFEDVDFCRRVANRGYRFYYEPQGVANHTGAHSIKRIGLEIRAFYWYRSLLRYSAKHFQPWKFRVVCFAVLTGSVLRSVSESAWHRSLKPLEVYGKVFRLAGRCLLFGWRNEVVVSGPIGS